MLGEPFVRPFSDAGAATPTRHTGRVLTRELGIAAWRKKPGAALRLEHELLAALAIVPVIPGR